MSNKIIYNVYIIIFNFNNSVNLHSGDNFRAAVIVCCFKPYDSCVAVWLWRMQLLPKHVAKLSAYSDERRTSII
jgi:hypothetical protein